MMDPAAKTSETWFDSVAAATGELEADLIAVRRFLHQRPELSGHEKQTTAHILNLCRQLKIPAHVSEDGHGLSAELIAPSDQLDLPRLGLRADIDALPIQDAKTVAYRSQNDGCMHACGHDVHAAILLGVLRVVSQLAARNELPWPVALRGIFQPAEEIATGARQMIRNRVLHDVAGILALHVDPTRSVGRIGLREGALTANCDMFRVVFRGRGGHGARPHLSIDPIQAACDWISEVYRAIPRRLDPHETVVVSVGRIEAGHSANVIPDTAELAGTLRAVQRGAQQDAMDTLRRIGESIQIRQGCQVDLQFGFSAPSVVNDTQLTRLLKRVAQKTIGPNAVEWIETPSMGSEDFSYYLEEVPGAMFRLGTAGEQTGSEPLHTPQFDVDERAIAIGVRLMTCAAIDYFDPSRHELSEHPATP